MMELSRGSFSDLSTVFRHLLRFLMLLVIVLNFRTFFGIMDGLAIRLADQIYDRDLFTKGFESQADKLEILGLKDFFTGEVRFRWAEVLPRVTDFLARILILFWQYFRSIIGTLYFILLPVVVSLSLVRELGAALSSYLANFVTLLLWPIYWAFLLRLSSLESMDNSQIQHLIVRLVVLYLIWKTPQMVSYFAIQIAPMSTSIQRATLGGMGGLGDTIVRHIRPIRVSSLNGKGA